MEVMVRNAPKQSTFKTLDNFLKPYLNALAIKSVHWTKHKNKTFAFLTFLHPKDGESFLLQHGQTRAPGGKPTRPRFLILYFGVPIYFEKSNNVPDVVTIRGLAKEEKDRQIRNDGPEANAKQVKFESVIFSTTSVACGTWTHVNNDLTFTAQVSWQVRGMAKFGQRSLILSLDSGKRIDFRYAAVLDMVTQKSPASIIISMKEPPRFFEKTEQPIEALLQNLLIPSQILPQDNVRSGPERHRIPFLDEFHEPFAGSCLVYRLIMPYVIGQSDYEIRFQKLSRISHLPTPVEHYTRDNYPSESYSQNMKRLRDVLASSNLKIPFEVAFQVQRLVSNNYLPPSLVLHLIPEVDKVWKRSGTGICVNSVCKLFTQIDFPSLEVDGTDFQLHTLIERLKRNEEQAIIEASYKAEITEKEPDVEEEDGYTAPQDREIGSEKQVLIHRARITPSGFILSGPEPETNNRVLRKYPLHHSYFLRVTLCDEDGSPVRQSFKVSNDKIFRGRFKEVLDNGIEIAGRHYDFLGFSHSSLRMQTCWFMAPFIVDEVFISDRQVIRDLGNFANITCPAKCAARIGQAFSDTPTAIKIETHVVVDDIKRGGRVFSDGVGTISRSLMNRICDSLRKNPSVKSTCFQVRYQGAKGMLALDPRLQGEVLNLRPSMIKFEGSTSSDLEICETSHKPLPLYLNRQLIKILEDMGVNDEFFLRLQAEEVERLRMITQNPLNASIFLERQSIGDSIFLPWLITELARLNLNFQNDGFLRDVVEVVVLFELRQLKHKTRIPVKKGWHLHGIMDETGLLEEGEIFCTVIVEGRTEVVIGKNLLISRSPALHPGDVQLVNAICPPEDSPLWQLSNCICFSQNGSRDLPSQLGGGDLDGDRFCIIFDDDAVAKRFFGPADYPRQEPLSIKRAVKKEDMTDFFIQFMESDQLGQIAVSHRVLADAKPAGTLDPSCILLAEMHSTAVDFSKTGISVDMSKFPKRPKFRPDFEAPGPHVVIEKIDGTCLIEGNHIDPQDQEDEDDDMPRYRYYESEKILGKLYRAIDEREIFAKIRRREAGITSQSTVIDAAWEWVQQECKLIQWEHLWDWALDIRDMYESSLMTVMIDYSDHPSRPLSELEAFVGNILGKTGAQNRVQHDTSIKMKERVDENNKFIVNCILKEGLAHSAEALERSIACLAVSLDQRKMKRKDSLLSFKYLAAAVCLRQVERFHNFQVGL